MPWPQKGDAVNLPLSGTAPVEGIGKGDAVFPNPNVNVRVTGGTTETYVIAADPNSKSFYFQEDPNNAGYPYIRADLSQATAATINELREAFQIQKLYERDARGGTRYTEIVQSHFGVTSPDARLQRPEYLGGGKDRVNVSPISQTSSTDATTPQGNMSAFATTGFRGHGFSKAFTEHSVVIGMACVFADLNYQQGLHRNFSRQTRWDFYWPPRS